MLFKQAGVLFKSGPEEALSRQEHDDEIGSGVELLPVGLGLQRGHVVTHVPGKVGKTLGTHCFVVGLAGIQQRLDRSLCVDNNRPATRQTDHEVGSESLLFISLAGQLRDEVAIGQHPGGLDSVLQLHFAPAAVNGRCAESGYEAASLHPQSLVRVGNRLQLRGKQPDILTTGLLQCLHFAADPLEGLLDRSDKAFDGFLPRVEIVLGSKLQLRELSLRKLDELLVVASEGFGTHRAELRGQFFSRLDQDRHLFRSGGSLVVKC